MFELVEAEKASYPVEALCEVLEISRSGYYAWKRRPAARRSISDAQLALEIAASHANSRGRYGSPRVLADLRAKGFRIGKKRVERLMRELGLVGRRKRRFRKTTDSNHAQPIAPNVLARDFAAAAPNQSWVTDVTYIATDEGWAYLAAILDLYSRRIVGWAISDSNDTVLALSALSAALRGRDVCAGLIHHSDRGSPYASKDYRDALDKHGIVASMSRKGDCWDNAVAESFFATLRAELVDHERYTTRAAAASSIGEYIDAFYNPRRRHSYLNYVSPIELGAALLRRAEAA